MSAKKRKNQADNTPAPAAPVPEANGGAPQSVRWAAGIAIAQSIVVIAFGIYLIYRDLSDAENFSMFSDSTNIEWVGTGTAIFIFIIFGFVIASAIAMIKGQRWGRGAIMLVEFILAASSFQMFIGGSPGLGAVTLASALSVIFLMLFMANSARWFSMNY